MKLVYIAYCLCFSLLVSCQEIGCTEEDFLTFMTDFGKVYQNDDEKFMRKAIFLANCMAIKRHNDGDSTFTMKINHFTDMTEEERNNYSKMEIPVYIPHKISSSWDDAPKISAPYSFNWGSYCGVTGVRSQGSCGACWVFQSVAVVESFIKIRTGVETDLSEQFTLECSSGDCSGGAPQSAMQTIVSKQGAPSETAYPYTTASGHTTKPSTPGICTADIIKLPYNTVYKTYSSISHETMKSLLTQSPVASYFWATSQFYSYSAGIFSCPYEPSMSQMNHGVMVFGYDANGNYYIKNSWGNRWGYQGFGLLKRDGDCGIRKLLVQLSDGTSNNKLTLNPACSETFTALATSTSTVYTTKLLLSLSLILMMISFM